MSTKPITKKARTATQKAPPIAARNLSKKVYIVHTGCYIAGEGDTYNFSAHTIIATTAAEAIFNVAPKFKNEKDMIEYPESVEFVIGFD
jgi:hypothetical protein